MTLHPSFSEYRAAGFEYTHASYWHSLSHDFQKVGGSPRDIALLKRPDEKGIYDILVHDVANSVGVGDFHEHENRVPLDELVRSIGKLFTTSQDLAGDGGGPQIIRAVQKGTPGEYQVSYKSNAPVPTPTR